MTYEAALAVVGVFAIGAVLAVFIAASAMLTILRNNRGAADE